MKAISVKGLEKSYGSVRAVKGVSFDVDEGEFFGFLGENGAGKSTTINILSTILDKTSGDIDILGFKLGVDDNKIRDNIGIVFQNSVLDDNLTVYQNIATRAGFYSISKDALIKRLDKLSDILDYDEIKNKKYMDLSGGQRRRVDLIRALINEPKILFLDEPTTGLDSKARKNIWAYLDLLRKNLNLTIFLTTHYMEETNDCDRIVVIDKGEIVANDSPKNLKNAYTYPKLIWYAEKTDINDKLIENFTNTYTKDHYIIKFEGDIHKFLYENRDRIVDFEYIKANMDDVFLNIRGEVL